MNSDMRAVRMHIQDLLREAEIRRLVAAGYRPPKPVPMLRLVRLLGRLGRSAGHLELGRFHRRYPETEPAEGIVDKWLKGARSVADESDGMQGVA